MKEAVVTLKSVTPYSQSRPVISEKKDKEGPDDFERRTWRERMHVAPDGHVQVPPMAIQKCLAETAKYLGIKIPGRGKERYTKHFLSGIAVLQPMVLNVKAETVEGEWLFVPSDGKPGGGSRVWKCFPLIPEWEGRISVYVLDDTITKEVFELHVQEAGKFRGIGRFRPANGGYYGRFEVSQIEWKQG